MIAHHELHGSSPASVETALTTEPLGQAVTQTIAAFATTSELLSAVGNLAVAYGVGKPLRVFQSLLATYRALARTQATLTGTAAALLLAAQEKASGD